MQGLTLECSQGQSDWQLFPLLYNGFYVLWLNLSCIGVLSRIIPRQSKWKQSQASPLPSVCQLYLTWSPVTELSLGCVFVWNSRDAALFGAILKEHLWLCAQGAGVALPAKWPCTKEGGHSPGSNGCASLRVIWMGAARPQRVVSISLFCRISSRCRGPAGDVISWTFLSVA